jgi:methyl-accepting chemotaxis protein
VINGISKEILTLSDAGRNGSLTVRGNASQYQGAFKEMVQGINETLDAIVTPLNESNDVLYKMAHGDLSVRIHNDYKGDLLKMKQSVNTVGESLSNALQNVAVSIQATATASSQISASVEEMTSGLNEQSSQTSEVASAVEEMAKTIMENSRNAVENIRYCAESETIRSGRVRCRRRDRCRNDAPGCHRSAFSGDRA